MKKTIIALGLGAFIAIAFSSCKKEYTCTCTDGFSEPYTETAKGKDATDACNDASKPLQLKVCVAAE